MNVQADLSNEANFENVFASFSTHHQAYLQKIKSLSLLKSGAEKLSSYIIYNLSRYTNIDDLTLCEKKPFCLYECLKQTLINDLKNEGTLLSKKSILERIYFLSLKIFLLIQSPTVTDQKHQFSIPDFDCIEKKCSHTDKCPDLMGKTTIWSYRTILREDTDSKKTAFVFHSKIAQGKYNYVVHVFDLYSCDFKALRVMIDPARHGLKWSDNSEIRRALSDKKISGIVQTYAFFPNQTENSKLRILEAAEVHPAELLEICDGNLCHLIKNKSYLERLDFAHQIIKIIAELESAHFIHGDLSFGNFLFKNHKNFVEIKLSDFDSISLINSTYEFYGTSYYLSRDIMMDSVNLEMIQRKKDAWSLGIILYEMLVCPLTKDDYLLSVSRSSADDFYKAQSLVQKYSIRTDLLVINNHLKSKTSKANWCKYFEKLTEDLIQKDRSNELLSEMKKALDLLIVNLLDLNPLDRMSSTQALIKFEEITKNFLSN